MGGERDRHLAALDRPFDAHDGRMDPQSSRDLHDDRVLRVHGVLRRPVAIWSGGRPDRRKPDRLDPLLHDVAEQVRLLEMRVEFHLVRRGPDPGILQQQLQLGDRHVGRPDVADETFVHELLQLAPGREVGLMDVRFRVRCARGHVHPRSMDVGEWPVDQIEVQVVEAEIAQ